MTKCHIFKIFVVFLLLSLKKYYVLGTIIAFMYNIYGVLCVNISLKERKLA